jgi:hypothetical protein
MVDEATDVESLVDSLRWEATALAGSIGSLAQRASVYHHMFEHSGRNHTFPLLAAHGALWAKEYFQAGMRFGSAAAWGQAMLGAHRQDLVRQLHKFADDFRDINRRVCVETYFIYHLTADRRLTGVSENIVPPNLLEQMTRCHAARRANRALSDNERRSVFTAFFLWEQENIVGLAVELAFDEFRWPLIKALALKPRIRFAYFPRHAPLVFKDFSDMNERIERGLAAFDLASMAGWETVEAALSFYGLMPREFSTDPARHFLKMAREVVGMPSHMAAATA